METGVKMKLCMSKLYMNKAYFPLLAVATLLSFFSGGVSAEENSVKQLLQAKQVIADRKATFTLIHGNFKPLGEVAQGKQELDVVTIKKHAERLVFLDTFLVDLFPASSNVGAPATKSKADIWTNGSDFKQELDSFSINIKALMDIASKEKYEPSDFKKAVLQVGQNCKGCHDKFKEK